MTKPCPATINGEHSFRVRRRVSEYESTRRGMEPKVYVDLILCVCGLAGGDREAEALRQFARDNRRQKPAEPGSQLLLPGFDE